MFMKLVPVENPQFRIPLIRNLTEKLFETGRLAHIVTNDVGESKQRGIEKAWNVSQVFAIAFSVSVFCSASARL